MKIPKRIERLGVINDIHQYYREIISLRYAAIPVNVCVWWT